MKKTTYLTGLLTLSTVIVASAQTSLYTTANDFGQFHGTPVTSASFYSDNSTLNGIGNTSTPGGLGTAGSLQLTLTGGWGQVPGGEFSFTDGNFASVQAMAPGSTGANIAAASGTISFDLNPGTLTSWWNVGLWVGYQNHNWWEGPQQFWGTSSSFTGADGNTWIHYSIPYTTAAETAGWFYMGIMSNSDSTPNTGKTFYVDNIQVQASVVPEPGTAAFALTGGAALLFWRRRSVR